MKASVGTIRICIHGVRMWYNENDYYKGEKPNTDLKGEGQMEEERTGL